MKTRKRKVLSFVLSMVLLLPQLAIIKANAAESFVPAPETSYAADFIAKSEGQQWFLDEIERLLNSEQKTINELENNAELANIKSIGLREKNIEGKIPKAVGELTELRYLFLSDNRLSGEIPQELFLLPKLENIDISNNAYSGTIPTGFGGMTSIKMLNFRGNSYTGTIPSDILANPNITFLDVSSNELSGGIQAGFNNMTGLTYLAVSDNNWGGSLPDLSALSALKALSAWNCKLNGTIPNTLYTLLDLQILDLAGNDFTGEISPNIGNLTELQLLSLGSNNLRGELPSSLGNLTKLQTIDISDNKLRGLLPNSLKARYDGGTKIYAQNNYMTGENLKNITNNQKNFTDLASSEQYQLISKQNPIQINETSEVNIYPYLQNKSYETGSVTNKPLLPAEDYVVAVTGGSAADISISIRADGIYIKANTEILKSANYKIIVQIKDNTGSNYSKTELQLTTEAVSVSPGGPSGPNGNTNTGIEKENHKPYINGYPDGTFRAGNNVSREEISKMVITVLEEDVSEAVVYTSYTDVKKDRWSAPQIEKSRKLGYLQGDPDGAFRPADSMTRAELAACLVRVSEKFGKEEGESKEFSDIENSKWYAESVQKAASLSLITGYADGTFRPEAKVTRAEAVTMINRMMGRNPKTASELQNMESPFSDTPKSNWDYLNILEASITHGHEK